MSIEKKCQGCREDQPNQMAHMEPGGCMYEEIADSTSFSASEDKQVVKRIVKVKTYPNSKCRGCRVHDSDDLAHMDRDGGCLYTTCEGCREQDSNELAHMEPGGCLRRPRYSTDDYDDYIEPEEIIKKSSEKIKIQYITYYYDKESKFLYADKDLYKAICKYDRLTGILSPL